MKLVSAVGGLLVVALAFPLALPARADVIEEIVAKVNDDIITKSELDREEQLLIAELYRRFTGEELDRQVQIVRSNLLQNLIDRKLLIHRAGRLYDLEKMKEVLREGFMSQQNIANKQELERLLVQDGITLEELDRRLVEMYAPEHVIGFEVTDRVAVGDAEIDEFYAENPEQFMIPAEVQLREIVLLAKTSADKDRRRAEAQQTVQRLREQGSDFATIAREISEAASAESGGKIGPFKRGELMGSLDEVAFSAAVGEVNDPVETEHGFHILLVESRTEDRSQDLEEVREQVRDFIRDRRRQEQLQEFLARARSEASIVVMPKYASRYDGQQ